MVGVDAMTARAGSVDRDNHGPRSVIVVGAGIVGLSTAWFLQERGVEVVVLDRSGVASGASSANAGWVAPGLVPLHEPAMLRHGLSSLLRPATTADDPANSDPGLWKFLSRVAANRRWSSWTRAVRTNLSLTENCLEAFDVLTTNGVDSPTVGAA